MEPKRVELMILGYTEDISEIVKGYNKIYVELAYGNIWFYKDGLQNEDAIKIESNKTYDINGIVQIQKLGKAKSKPTVYFTLFNEQDSN